MPKTTQAWIIGDTKIELLMNYYFNVWKFREKECYVLNTEIVYNISSNLKARVDSSVP